MDARYFVIFGTFYFAGALIAAYRLERRLTAPLLSFLLLALLATWWEPRAFTAVLWIALPAAAIALGRSGNRASAWLSARGDFSYGLYIYAFPVQQTLVMLWPEPADPAVHRRGVRRDAGTRRRVLALGRAPGTGPGRPG